MVFGLVIFAGASSPVWTQGGGNGAGARSSYSPPRTPWGDPDIQGTYTNKDENGTPMERPAEFDGLTLDEVDAAVMARLRDERQARAQAGAASIGGSAQEDTGAGPSHWYEHLDSENARPWLVFDPPDGRIPPMTAAAQERQRAQFGGRGGGRAGFGGNTDSFADRSLYDRCISLGVPGSMTPMIYGNAYDITQAPGYVAIRYEMIHEARVIPLDGSPHLPSSIRPYMGDARGHWDGNALVVETTNINPAMCGGRGRSGGPSLRLIERFIPVDENTLRWEVRYDDPDTWEQSWAYAMPLKRDAEHAPFEYACHEGNRGLANILSAARAEEAEASGR
jgi:hypothetical protein